MKQILPILVLVALAGCSEHISDFQSKNFIKFFGSGEGSSILSAIETPDGYIFTGYDTHNNRKQVFVAKVDSYGNMLWSNIFTSDSIQQGLFVRKLDQSSYIIVGSSQALTTNTYYPILIKIDAQGNTIFKKHLTNSNSIAINDIIITGQTVLLAGESYSNKATPPKYFAANYSVNGDKIWAYTSVSVGSFKRIYTSSNGTCYFIGNDTYSSMRNITINKLSASNPISDIPRKITLDGNFTGIADIDYDQHSIYILINKTDTGAEVIKLDENFGSVWTSTQLPEQDRRITPSSLTLRSNGTLMICGQENDNIRFTAIDEQGNVAGSNQYKQLYGFPSQIISTADGGILVAGATSKTYYEMMQLIKTDASLYLLSK